MNIGNTVYINEPAALYHGAPGKLVSIDERKIARKHGHGYQVEFQNPSSPLWFRTDQISLDPIPGVSDKFIEEERAMEKFRQQVREDRERREREAAEFAKQYEARRQPAQQAPAPRDDPATPKQLAYLESLNAWHAPDITKRAASDLIGQAKCRIVDPALYAVKPIRAACELCGETRPVEEMAAGQGGHDWDNPDDDFAGSVGLLSYRCADGTGCRANRKANAEAATIVAEIDHYGRYDDRSPGQIGGGL